MYAPSAVRQIQPASTYGFAGVCQSVSPFNPGYGWFVPYRQVREHTGAYAYRAVIKMLVEDLSPGSTFADVLPFAINPGADVTVIPRQLLARTDAFPPTKALGPYQIGETAVGLCFRTAMTIAARSTRFTPLTFGILRTLVVDYWRGEYGILGRDALQQVVMVSDSEHVSLWPQPTGGPARAPVHDATQQPTPMSREEARKVANFYIVMNLGDALLPAEMELREIEGRPVWWVVVVHRRTRRRFGVLHIAVSGTKRVTWHPEPNTAEVSAPREND